MHNVEKILKFPEEDILIAAHHIMGKRSAEARKKKYGKGLSKFYSTLSKKKQKK